MNNFKVLTATSTNVSWRDEISYSHDLDSEGLKKVREALKQAKASAPEPEMPDIKKCITIGGELKTNKIPENLVSLLGMFSRPRPGKFKGTVVYEIIWDDTEEPYGYKILVKSIEVETRDYTIK